MREVARLNGENHTENCDDHHENRHALHPFISSTWAGRERGTRNNHDETNQHEPPHERVRQEFAGVPEPSIAGILEVIKI